MGQEDVEGALLNWMKNQISGEQPYPSWSVQALHGETLFGTTIVASFRVDCIDSEQMILVLPRWSQSHWDVGVLPQPLPAALIHPTLLHHSQDAILRPIKDGNIF